MKAIVQITFIITVVFLIDINAIHAAGMTPDFRSILLGYGTTVPGIGATTQRLNTVEVGIRYGFVRKENINKRFPDNTNLFIFELPMHIISGDTNEAMVGANFLSMWSFNTQGKHHPYIFVGGGPVYSSKRLEGMGRKLNGNYQLGVGVFCAHEGPIDHSIEIRLHHISNGNTADPNVPLNGIKLIFGYHIK